MTAEPHLLLVGAGHAHLHLLARAERLSAAGYRVSLVAPRWFDYSGTASAVATGALDGDAGRVDVAALSRGRVRHHDTLVRDLELTARTAATEDGEVLRWDVLSLNLGSVSAAPPGVPVADDVLRVKPLSSLHELDRRLADGPRGPGSRVTVVGAGPTGVELAAHLAVHPGVGRVALLDSADHVGGALPTGAARRLGRLLARRGVDLRTGAALDRVASDRVAFRDGTELPHDLAVLATGLTAPPLARAAGVGGPDGIPVRATLQHRDHADVYAAGDCADFLPGPLERVGVHGVRQGPVLLAALEARVSGGPPPTYRPRRHHLSVLDLGGGTALAVRGRWWWLGRSSLALKRAIDSRWLATYRL